MENEIRKVVGKNKLTNPLKRVFALNNFIRSLNQKITSEPNIKPIRKIVGRPR